MRFFGSSLVSAYWNGAATYYRGLLHALAHLGHRVTFYEPDIYQRQAHRDIDDPPWARVEVYPGGDAAAAREALSRAAGADLVVKCSGVGEFDDLLEEAVLELQSAQTPVVFLDVDAPATLARAKANKSDPFRRLIPRFDAILTYGGGEPVISAYAALGARSCTPVYNALDPRTHHPVEPDKRFACDLAFLGNRLPDRESRVEQFFIETARRLPKRTFVLGGSGWDDKPLPRNVRYVGHVYTADHNAFNVTPLAVLNVTRESMTDLGYSPATRVFEAAGAGACIVSDAWKGLEEFFEPGREILPAAAGADVAEILEGLSVQRARATGKLAMERALAEHTYARRARTFEQAIARCRAAGAVAAG
jgi:spore maturation protein CgeB